MHCMEDIELGILDAVRRRRETPPKYLTIDGGHPAPYPDMTDEQLYNYEMAFNIPHKTFDKPPVSKKKATEQPTVTRERPRPSREPGTQTRTTTQKTEPRPDLIPTREHTSQTRLDFTQPIRTITTKQPVEIITTRVRHPVFKVHGYIGDADVITVFTLDGRISENGPRFLENVPRQQQLYLNVYLNPDLHSRERFVITQHGSKEEADAAARTSRVACVPLQFDFR